MANIKTPDGGFYLDDTEFNVDHNKKTVTLVSPGGGSGVAGVSSFNGRTGAVMPQNGDYTAEQVGALPVSGGTMTGNIDLGDNNLDNVAGISMSNSGTITGLGTPTNNEDAANKQYVDNTVSAVVETVNDIIDGTETIPYLPDNGGTLTGVLNMGNNKITMGATPTETTDVTNKGYVDGVVGVVSDEVDGIIAGTTSISVPVATDTKVGGVLQAAGVTDATSADDIITQFNALLASLRTSGVLQDNT